MIAVVDASVGAKWLFPAEDRADSALALLQAALDGHVRLHVPPLFLAEVANVVRQRMRREAVPLDRAMALLDRLLGLPLYVDAPDDIVRLALPVADRHGLPAIYSISRKS